MSVELLEPPAEAAISRALLPLDSARAEDASLMAGVVDNEAAAIAELYERHAPAALRLARRMVRSAESAEEVVQDASSPRGASRVRTTPAPGRRTHG